MESTEGGSGGGGGGGVNGGGSGGNASGSGGNGGGSGGNGVGERTGEGEGIGTSVQSVYESDVLFWMVRSLRLFSQS